MIAQTVLGLADEARLVETRVGHEIEAGPEPPDERTAARSSLRHWRLAGSR